MPNYLPVDEIIQISQTCFYKPFGGYVLYSGEIAKGQKRTSVPIFHGF